MAPLVSVFKVREPRLREVKEFCKVTQLKLTKPRLVSRSGRLTRALPPQEALGPSLRCARWSSRRILLHRDQRSKGKGRGLRRGGLRMVLGGAWCLNSSSDSNASQVHPAQSRRRRRLRRLRSEALRGSAFTLPAGRRSGLCPPLQAGEDLGQTAIRAGLLAELYDFQYPEGLIPRFLTQQIKFLPLSPPPPFLQPAVMFCLN